AWPERASPRIAGVSSFGFGGTNAHVVLEQAVVAASSPINVAQSSRLLTLSAASAHRLAALAKGFGSYLSSTAEACDDICSTANARHTHHDYRPAVVAKSCVEASSALMQRADAAAPARAGAAADEQIAFVFTGQGA